MSISCVIEGETGWNSYFGEKRDQGSWILYFLLGLWIKTWSTCGFWLKTWFLTSLVSGCLISWWGRDITKSFCSRLVSFLDYFGHGLKILRMLILFPCIWMDFGRYGYLLLLLCCRDPKGPYGLFLVCSYEPKPRPKWSWVWVTSTHDVVETQMGLSARVWLGKSTRIVWIIWFPDVLLVIDIVNCCCGGILLLVLLILLSLLWSREWNGIMIYFVKCCRLCGLMGTDCETVKLEWRR